MVSNSIRAGVLGTVSAVARGGVWSTDGAVTGTLALFLRVLLAAALFGLLTGSCGGEPRAGAEADVDVDVGSPFGGAPSFSEDLVSAAAAGPGNGGDVLAEVREALSTGASAPAPRVIYLAYADGNPLPKTNVNACRATPPKFRCGFASSLLECQRQVQRYLDRWYADFNVVFTFTRPVSGAFNTVVVSSGGGAWCDVDPQVAGVAPFLCNNLSGGVVYAFRGGENARETAVIIAQEQAHLIGLEHTASDADLMSPTICTTCDGFEDVARPVVGDRCGRKTQTSHQMMLDRLGAWPGGPKPSPFGCQADSASPVVRIVEPADRSMVARDFTVRVEATGECAVASVEVNVAPSILHAAATTPPFKWDLSNISGQQTIAVTAIDERGHSTVRNISVTANGDSVADVAGCSISPRPPRSLGTTLGLAAAIAAVAMGRRRGRDARIC